MTGLHNRIGNSGKMREEALEILSHSVSRSQYLYHALKDHWIDA